MDCVTNLSKGEINTREFISEDRNSETREKYYPYFGWRPIGAEIDKC